MTAFWGIAPCSLTEVYRCFTGVYCLHQQATLMETVSSPEMSVYFYETAWSNIPAIK
jgi:hypothetical protein